jgi:soluble cytochrome b562
MSVSGISSSSFFEYDTESIQKKMKQAEQEFQQLGEDLQSGNLSAAQSDFVTLQQLGPQDNSSDSSSPMQQAQADFEQLGQDLQSGDLSAAQSDLTALQQLGQQDSSSNPMQQIQQAFQQLGSDLQSGDLSAAQSDLTTLQQLLPQNDSTSSSSSSTSSSSTSSTATSSSSSSNSITQAFSQLSQDLQSGDLSAAQKDYTTIQQDLQNQGTQTHHHHHHSSSGSDGNTIGQTFDQLDQALQSGDLSAAQQAYSTLQQAFQQFAQSDGLSSTQTSTSSSSSVSINA